MQPLEDKQDWTAIFQFHMICTAEAINFAFLLVMIVYKVGTLKESVVFVS